MFKNLPIIIFVGLIVGAGFFWIRFFAPEDTWLCENNVWVQHGKPTSPKPNTGCGDKIVLPIGVSGTTTARNPNFNTSSSNIVPYLTTVSGLYVCLPASTKGPQTTDCALGLMTDKKIYYALDTRKLERYLIYPTGTHLKVFGVLTPVEIVNSDAWKKYDIKGIISLDKVEEIE